MIHNKQDDLGSVIIFTVIAVLQQLYSTLFILPDYHRRSLRPFILPVYLNRTIKQCLLCTIAHSGRVLSLLMYRHLYPRHSVVFRSGDINGFCCLILLFTLSRPHPLLHRLLKAQSQRRSRFKLIKHGVSGCWQ